MLGRRLLYVLALLAATLFLLFNTFYLAHFLFWLMLTLPVLSLLLSLPGVLGSQVRVEPVCDVRRGEPAAFRVFFENRWALPLSRVRLRLQVQNCMTGEKSMARVSLTGLGQAVFVTQPVDALHCGAVRCRAEKVRVSDLLGLFSFCRAPASGQLLVLPLLESPGPLPERDDRPRAAPPRRPAGAAEDYDLRSYRPGDPMRLVHWKLSSKHEDLIVREMLPDSRPTLVLRLEHTGSPSQMDRRLDRLNDACCTLIARQQDCRVQWVHPRSGALRSYTVRTRQQLDACLAAVLADPAPAEGQSIRGLPLLQEQEPTVLVYITPGEEETPCPQTPRTDPDA